MSFRSTRVAAACGLLLSSAAFAQVPPTLDKVKAEGVITVAHRESSIPFSYLGAEGKPVGFVQGDHEGEFTPKVVHPGETVDGQTAIAAGLEPGQRVVTRGAFMVKAQAMKSENATAASSEPSDGSFSGQGEVAPTAIRTSAEQAAPRTGTEATGPAH